MRIIITRPKEDGAALTEKLRERGHDPVLMPLIKIVPRITVQIPRKRYNLICLTSANGVRFNAFDAVHKKTRLLTVGAHSMQAALEAGFENVAAEGGDIVGLLKYIMEHYRPQNGSILYISGAETSGDLEGKLKQTGYDVDRIVTYDAIASSLSNELNAIQSADAVMLYSARSAKIWSSEIKRLNLDEKVSQMMHYCLSPHVAAALPQNTFKMIAKQATEADILALLDYQHKAE